MPLTVHLSLVVASSLLLLLSSTTSCLGSQYQDCSHYPFPCGDFHFWYPFGRNGSGCGEPDFQLDCNDNSGHAMLNINGEKYLILEPFWFNSSMKIINDNLFVSKCNLSGNYSQLWSPGSHFSISDDAYTNLTLSRQCHKGHEEVSQLRRFPLCGEDWYYNIRRPEHGRNFCQTHHQVPIKRKHLYPNFTFNQDLLFEGFEITWWVDLDRHRRCDDCGHSGGRCGYNISEQFVCYCPDGSANPEICPHPHGRKNRSGIVIGCSVGGAALTAIALVLFLMYYVKGRKQK